MKPAPIKETISFDEFSKVDIRVGTILIVADIEGSNKLVKLLVDFGDHSRSILAGIKQEREDPKEIEGKQALFVLNIPERKMAGEVSQGMLFDLGYADKITPCLAIPDNPVPNGTRAG
jgi:tRNA-binding protein